MWPWVIFFSLIAIVLLQFWWQELRFRHLRAKAREEFSAETLKQQQETLAHARAQQEALFDSMVDGVLVLDESGRVELINESSKQLFNLRQDVRGQSLIEAFRVAELCEISERLRREERVEDVEIILRGEKERCVLVNASVISAPRSEKRGAIFVFHDRTRIQELENTRKDFVANVSHELRTPLSLIKGFTETLLHGAKDDPENATRFLRKIEKHSDRLLYLIEDLLTISRLEAGHEKLNRQAVNLRALTDCVFEELAGRAHEKNVALETSIPSTTEVLADADRLQQVIANLVENAIKYGRAGGKVSVFSRDLPGEGTEIGVQDDGPGIPQESLGRIFERFYRVDRARSRETGGTGLGLAIVKHIVQAHGGRVGVTSEAQRGTTFYFTIPNSPKAA